MASRYHGDDAQPGLEVVPQERGGMNNSWPEVRDTSNNDTKELLVNKYPGSSTYNTEAPQQYDPDLPERYEPPLPPLPGAPATDPAADGARKRRRRMCIVIGAVVAAIIILAAVLGGVLGTRAAAAATATAATPATQSGGFSSGGSGTVTPAGSSPSATPRPEKLRQGSGLTVTAMRKVNGGMDLFLFYQDPKDEIWYSRCDTSLVISGSSRTCWEDPITFNTFAQPGARLSVGSILFGLRMNPQVQFVYTGDRSRLLSSNINDLSTPRIIDDSVNSLQIVTGANSSLSSYWPWTIYQDPAGRLHHVRNRLLGGFSPASEWDDNRIEVTALTGSALAIVPMSTNITRIAVKGGYGVFYQNADGRLAVSITDLNSPELDSTYSLSWPTTLPSITLPRGAPIAAFSVARPSDSRQRVDSHVLYLDAASNINVLSTDASSGSAVWRTSQPAALRGVDPDSKLTCVNMATTTQNAAGSEQLIETASEDTKCYFQKGGLVMEARLDKGDWIVTGSVPMP